MVTGTKFSQIPSGGSVAGATDKAVVVRSGTTDLLVDPVALDIPQTFTAAQTFQNITFSADATYYIGDPTIAPQYIYSHNIATNDIIDFAGNPYLTFSGGAIQAQQNLIPSSDHGFNLGTGPNRFNNIWGSIINVDSSISFPSPNIVTIGDVTNYAASVSTEQLNVGTIEGLFGPGMGAISVENNLQMNAMGISSSGIVQPNSTSDSIGTLLNPYGKVFTEDLQINNGNVTAGYVWTATDTIGNGTWAPTGGGGGGSPGGSSGDVQYNNSGVFGGTNSILPASYQMYDSNNNIALTWDVFSKVFYDDFGNSAVDVNRYTLNDASGNSRYNWQSGDISDGLFISIQASNRELIDNFNVLAMDWTQTNRKLFDNSGVKSIDFDGRFLETNAGSPALDWSANSGSFMVVTLGDNGNTPVNPATPAGYLTINLPSLGTVFLPAFQ